MTKNLKDTKQCIWICSFVFCFVFFALFTEYLIPLMNYNVYEENSCHITRVDYPATIPVFGDTTNWKECNCGKYCKAWYPCVKLYTDIENSDYVQDTYSDPNLPCSFFERDCPNGENAQFMTIYLNESEMFKNQYLDQNVTCYYNEDRNSKNSEIFLEKNLEENISITLTIILVILCFIIIYNVVINYCSCKSNKTFDENKEKKTKEISNVYYV